MVRTPSCDKSGMRKGTWTPEEDMKLIAYVTRYGCWNWRQLPKFAGLARCGKSCRLRWMNYLRPNIKRGNFTQQEEECIIRMHKKLGNRWSAIAAELPGRTDNEIKNHWHTALKKRSQQNTLINEETTASKSKNKESVDNKGVFVTLPATSQISDNSSLSPVSSTCSEFSSITSDLSPAASCTENLVFEDDDLGFLDLYNIDPMNENLWTELNLDDISFNTPCEIVSGDTNINFQSSSSSNSNTLDSPHQSTSESIVVNDDFGRFLDSYEEATVDNFWTPSYVADMSHVPSELLVPSVAESEYFTPLYDDLWGQTHLYHENHCLF